MGTFISEKLRRCSRSHDKRQHTEPCRGVTYFIRLGPGINPGADSVSLASGNSYGILVSMPSLSKWSRVDSSKELTLPNKL